MKAHQRKRNVLRRSMSFFASSIVMLSDFSEGFQANPMVCLHLQNNLKQQFFRQHVLSSPGINKGLVGDREKTFQPRVKKLRESAEFFAQYVAQYARKRNDFDLQSEQYTNLNSNLFRSQVEVDSSTTEEKLGIRETISVVKSSVGEIISLVNYDRTIIKSSLTFLMLGAAMESTIPHFYGQCLHCVSNAMTTSRLSLINSLSGLAITSILAGLFTGMRGSLFWMAGSRANYSTRVKLHRHLLQQEAAFFDENETGVFISRLNSDVNKIGMVISFHVNVVLRQLAQVLFGSIYMIRTTGKLSLLAYAGMAAITSVSAVYGSFANRLADKVQSALAKGTAVAETSFTMSETIRAFDGVHIESGKYENAQSDALELEEVQAWSYGLHKFITTTMQVMMKCVVMYACWLVGSRDGMNQSQLTRFLFYVNFVSDSSLDVGDQWAKIQAAIGASKSVVDLLRRKPKIVDPKIIDSSVAKVLGSQKRGIDEVINIRNMTVSYEGVASPALTDIDLKIYPGDRVAIVGRSGSGKSSLLRSLLRFYDPSSGSVSLDGFNLKDLTRKELSKRICVVEQEPHLFPISLLENVLYGIEKDERHPLTGESTYSSGLREEALKSLDLAGLSVRGKNDLDLELDTRVGDGGRTLSGGQRQRVAIARALVRCPDVLLLDEPTAALDSKSEGMVVEALKNAMKASRCMLMVTHRLGVVRSVNVNKVIVLEQGRIAEFGDPEVLLERGGIYSQLAAEQGIFTKDYQLQKQ